MASKSKVAEETTEVKRREIRDELPLDTDINGVMRFADLWKNRFFIIIPDGAEEGEYVRGLVPQSFADEFFRGLPVTFRTTMRNDRRVITGVVVNFEADGYVELEATDES